MINMFLWPLAVVSHISRQSAKMKITQVLRSFQGNEVYFSLTSIIVINAICTSEGHKLQ